MPIAIDGSVHANGSASSLGGSLTTTAAGLVVACVTTNGGPVTSVTGASLTFTQHSSDLAQGSAYNEIWTAPSTGAITAQTITVNTTTSNFITIDIFGVSENDSSNIFDDDASIPSTGTDPITISTDATNTMLLASYRFAGTPTPTAGTGFTAVNGGDYQLVEYQVVTSAQTNADMDVGTGVSDSNAGNATAIREAAGGAARRRFAVIST